MLKQQKFLAALFLLMAFFALSAMPARASGKEYEAVVRHLKTKYQAKKVKIPMIWLARFAVRMVRPAGVKSFSVTTFENLKFTPETLDAEMQSTLRNSFGKEWNPIFRARSRGGQQAYMYAKETGGSIKIMVVSFDKEQAAVIRAAFSPERLVDFINNPKILGVSLEDDNQRNGNKSIESKQKSESLQTKS